MQLKIILKHAELSSGRVTLPKSLDRMVKSATEEFDLEQLRRRLHKMTDDDFVAVWTGCKVHVLLGSKFGQSATPIVPYPTSGSQGGMETAQA